VNTIGAVDTNNIKAVFSAFGTKLDVWAPGVSVPSAWIGGPAAFSAGVSGTSFASPHAAGILAVAISKYGNKKPGELTEDLKKHARPQVTYALGGSNNLLATLW